jgi:hypothetical protein
LLPSGGKLALSNLWSGLEFALFGVMISYFSLPWTSTIFPPPAHPALDPSLSSQQIAALMHQWNQANNDYLYTIFLGIPVVVALLFGCIAALLDRRAKASLLLVLLPEGLVYGKRSRQKVLHVINYWEVAQMRPGRRHITIVLFKKNGGTKRRRLDLSPFASTRTIAQDINTAYEDYKKNHDPAQSYEQTLAQK